MLVPWLLHIQFGALQVGREVTVLAEIRLITGVVLMREGLV